MMTFVEKEKHCENLFESMGPFWHIYTDGNTMTDIFCCDEDMKLGMIALAVAACQTPEIDIITFEQMNNHLHIIARGPEKRCLDMFERFSLRTKRVFQAGGKVIDWDPFKANILLIENLKALRNEIIYVNRNAFVANPRYTPFSYPWGGGCAYFSPFYRMLPTTRFQDCGINTWRRLTHCRDIDMLKELEFIGDIVFIPSFCRIDVGESLFHDARSYFNALTRNAEAFSLIASRLQDSIFLTDDELYAVSIRFADNEYGNRQLALLTPEQKIRTAKELHYRYNASNQQIRRILKIDPGILSELFP